MKHSKVKVITQVSCSDALKARAGCKGLMGKK